MYLLDGSASGGVESSNYYKWGSKQTVLKVEAVFGGVQSTYDRRLMLNRLQFTAVTRLRGAGIATDLASATSATADGLAPEGASQTKKFFLQVIKKRPRKPDVANVHEWCSAATDSVFLHIFPS
ncbi:hypothetical protein EVAR_81474_1 [Eumeta japonica]|uniref:Uncharacterized protein n=1 Tax=Eumeta variegata TaxID=151549 RepID=A0A4C1VZM7_EUMVA|nr:hypothetical protein EVAR_81474_1 [Eumeta japonica]